MRDLNFGSRSDGGTSNGYGVNGPATFKIAKGSYNELLTVYGVSGSSSTNTITFESATGKAEDVVIWYENNPGNAIAQILNLDGAYHLRFYNLTFKILGSLPDGRAITIDNYASYNIFKGNIIEGKKVTTNNINFVNAAIFISKVNNANNSFINNRISNGAYGIYRSGQSRVSGIVLEGNIIDSAYINGVYLGRVESLAIEKNKITNTLKEAGVVLFECEKDIQFNKNRIYSESNTSGVEITGTYWDTTTRVFVSNNFIIAGKNAVHLKYARKAEIYFNNLISNHAFNTSDKCAAIAVDIFTKGRIYNNNLVGKRNSYALFGYDTSGKFYDYNNLYTANIKPVFIASTEYSLSDWRNYSNNDAHSISVDPLFSSSYDLHTGHPALNMAGIHISGIKDDIDGELRLDNNPDIGADEYIAFRNDASLQPADSIGSVCLGDIRNVYVKLQNTGTNILKSLSINWKVNTTARKTINWTGNLNPGTEILLKLDSVGFKTALYNIQIISSKPNGINDSNAVFDTIVYKNINTLMHGEFTVGGTNADYSTIQAAISDLRLRGVCGKTTFKIRDGVYTEQLKIINIKGAGSKNNIVFKSESKDSSKVIITFPTNTDVKNNYSLSLSGANYITFQCVTFTRTGNESSSNIIDLSAGASNNSFLNCRITGRTFKHAYNETVTEKQKYSYFLVNATGDYSENKNVFRNNFFSKAYMGIYFPVYRDAYEKGNIIYGNIFDSILFSVIEVEAQDSLFVTNNRVTNCHNSGIKVSGISLVSPTFNKNFIQNNKLGILKGDVGMRVFGDAVVSNNEITFSPVKQQSSLPYGLSVGYFINAEIYYNTVYVHGDTLKGTKAFFIYGANSSAKSLKLNNNNFANFTGGLAGDFNGYRSLATSDRNNWYRVGSVGANLIDSYTSLSSWKTATGKDANSVSVDPWFLSIKNPEPQNPLISDKGIPVSGFPRDINGNYRNTGFPSIGSREFSSVYYDVGISQVTGLSRTFCSGKYNVNVWVRNYGANSINTISFGWKTDSTNQATTSWAGILKGGDSVLVNLGTADFSDAYKTPASIVKAWTIIPLYSEGDNNNDTVSYTAFGKLNGIYTVGGSAAHYKSISQAGNDLQLRGMCGPVTIKIKDGIYTEQLMLNNVDGNSIKNSFTLESESGDSSKVTWQYPSAVNDYRNFILHTEGIKSVNIRNITFRRTGELKFGTVIKIHKSDGHIVFSGNRIYGSLQERFVKIDENENILFGCFGDSFQNITLTGNLFNRGEIAVYIAGNLFSGSYYSYPKIKKEIIADNKAEDCTIGLKIAGPDSGLIQNNILHCWRMGLYMGNARKNVTVQRNKIHVIKQVERANVPFAAMYIGAFSGILINNVVSAKNVTAVHLSLDSGKVYNNSVLVYGNIKSLALDLAGGGIICNNSFVNLTGGVVFNALNQYSNFKFSYNNLYTTGVYIGYYYHRYTHYGYAYGNGNNINPSPSFPEVFVYVDPNYRSVDDLRTKHPLLDSAGVFAKFIKYDFDGNLRDTLKPDIGAFEFDTYDTDFAMHSYENTFSESCADTAFKLTVEVINHGKSSQKNIPVSAIITNGKNIVILKDTIRASVAPQTTYKHTFKNAFSTLGSGPFTVKAYTNIAGEQDRRDDTLRFEIAPRGTSPRTDSLYAVCPGKTLEIKPEKGNSTDKLHWYSDNTTSTELFTGDSFDAKNSMGDTTLFVSASNTESFNLFNKEGASGTWSYLHSFSTPSSPGAHTSFRVFRDLSIDSLTVFPRDSARFTINFYDSSKVIVFTKSYSVSVNKEGEPARISVGAALGKGFYYIGIDEIKYGLIQLSSNHTEYVRENTIRFVFNLASVGFSNLRISLPSCSESKRVPVKIKTIQRINPIISKGATFEGIFNKGDISNPDVICAGNSLSYNLATDYKNSEYNKTWLINYAAVLDSSNNSSADTSFVKPTSSANAIIAFTPSVNTKPGLYKLFITSKSIPGKCDTSITRYIRILGGAKVLNF
ncbi:MAG: NosD domain-containing protein, partial [Bacteroidia bacterium]